MRKEKHKVLSIKYKVKSTLYFGLCTLYFFSINDKLPLFDGEDAFFPKNITLEDTEVLLQSDKPNTFHFIVSPNPTNRQVRFTVEVEQTIGMEIVITDLQGKIIKIITVANTSTDYELKDLPNGIYLAHLTKNGIIQNTQKIMYAH